MSELEKTVVAGYAKALEKLSDEAKAELIKLLLKPSEKDKKSIDERFWSSFGSWPSDRPGEEIIDEIRSSRRFRDKDLSF